MQIKRNKFYSSRQIFDEVQKKIDDVKKAGDSIDYLTFVADGEPTLDMNLGWGIELLKTLRHKVAVITNASLIWRKDIRKELLKADWVSLKVDSVREEVWRKINRPHRDLKLNLILSGILEFTKAYRGELATETMLIEGVNDSEDDIKKVSDFLAQLPPVKAYLSVPIRPPAEKYAGAPDERVINACYQIFRRKIDNVECLMGYEGDSFSFTGDVKRDLLSITAVHPMREEAVREFLSNAGANWAVIDKLIAQDDLIETLYGNRKFYVRKIPARVSK